MLSVFHFDCALSSLTRDQENRPMPWTDRSFRQRYRRLLPNHLRPTGLATTIHSKMYDILKYANQKKRRTALPCVQSASTTRIPFKAGSFQK